jgi:HAD superfamily hydrolase (TIGR01484 family)
VVVTGQAKKDVRKQIPVGVCYLLTQTGNYAISKDGNILWEETFTEKQTSAVLAFIERLKAELNLSVKDPDDLVELRGSQISYSIIGHHEALQKKYTFDRDQSMRRRILAKHPTAVAELNELGVDVIPGGTTCLDFFMKGRNKGFNVARLIEHEGWKKEDSLYVGDALFPGGNDETVIGVIPTRAVKNDDDTFTWIQTILSS